MGPSLIEIGSKMAEKNSAQTDRHYENNGHLAVNQWLVSAKFSENSYSAINYQ